MSEGGGDRPPRIMIVAGEASGDNLGGALLEALRVRFPGLESCGVGGKRMIDQGCHTLCDLNALSVIGLVEVLRRLPRLVWCHRRLTAWMAHWRPDLLITIDLPDFNFLLARRARALGIPRMHYVGPQVWAWRAGRVGKLARLLDHLLVLFPFESAVYAGSGLPVTFVGHPLALLPVPDVAAREAIRSALGVSQEERLLLLLPGSRLGEIRRHLGIMVEAARRVAAQGGVRCVLAVADTLSIADLEAVIAREAQPETRAFFARIDLRPGMTRSLMAAADAALACSGTVTLEAALMELPMTVLYRVNPLTYEIGRRVIRVGHIALPNLVAGRGLVPERIQAEAEPERLAGDVRALLFDRESAEVQRIGFREIRARLCRADRSAAEVVADWLQRLGWAG